MRTLFLQIDRFIWRYWVHCPRCTLVDSKRRGTDFCEWSDCNISSANSICKHSCVLLFSAQSSLTVFEMVTGVKILEGDGVVSKRSITYAILFLFLRETILQDLAPGKDFHLLWCAKITDVLIPTISGFCWTLLLKKTRCELLLWSLCDETMCFKDTVGSMHRSQTRQRTKRISKEAWTDHEVNTPSARGPDELSQRINYIMWYHETSSCNKDKTSHPQHVTQQSCHKELMTIMWYHETRSFEEDSMNWARGEHALSVWPGRTVPDKRLPHAILRD